MSDYERGLALRLAQVEGRLPDLNNLWGQAVAEASAERLAETIVAYQNFQVLAQELLGLLEPIRTASRTSPVVEGWGRRATSLAIDLEARHRAAEQAIGECQGRITAARLKFDAAEAMLSKAQDNPALREEANQVIAESLRLNPVMIGRAMELERMAEDLTPPTLPPGNLIAIAGSAFCLVILAIALLWLFQRSALLFSV